MTVEPNSDAGDDRARLRISDADREAAAQRLHTALAEGRITMMELDERLGVVYSARTYADLEPPFADLPGGSVVPSAPAAVPAKREFVELRTGMGSIRRDGQWAVPRHLRISAGMGTVRLDFTETAIPHPVIDIEAESSAGSMVLVLPDGATADIDGFETSMGSAKSGVPSQPTPGLPHFVVTGRSGMGSLTVRYRRGYRRRSKASGTA